MDRPFGVDDPLHHAHPHDLRRCTGKKGEMWLAYTQQRLETGEVFGLGRGKEFSMVAGQVCYA